MTVTEILRTTSADDVLNAINNYVHNVTSGKGRPNDRFVSYGNKDYPAKELLKQATPNLKNTSNYSNNSYTSDVAQKRLEELGFKVVVKKNTKVMYKYYLKKVSNQDVEKTTVINAEAEHSFFGVSIPERDDSASISIMYLSDGVLDNDVKLIKKQDIRIFIDRSKFVEGDILLFENIQNKEFLLSIIAKYDNEYSTLLSSLKNNYLLTDDLPEYDAVSTLAKDLNSQYRKHKITPPLNQILYGPPGTGKTYSTVTKALNIIGLLKKKDSYSNEEYENAQMLFQKELGERIEFVTMHQSFSYEDFVQGLKPKKGEKGIEFDYKNGVFKEICERAWNFDEISRHTYFASYVLSRYEDILVDSKILPNNLKTQNDRLDYFSSLLDDAKSQIMVKGPRDCFDRLLGDKSPREGWTKENYKNKDHWETCEETLKFFQLISPERCIDLINKNWIKPAKDRLELHEKNLSKIIRDPFVIVLDEINRANISRVFGELIALIEEDKRDGKLTATLPSGDSFSVPSNLYILGTMNTADKSIALVDIALRRRFRFIPMYPDLLKLENVLKEKGMAEEVNLRREVLSNLNRLIRSKKSVDFEIGHSYFMSRDKIEDIMNDQVLPLLNEYFMYDLRVVKDLLENQQYDKDKNKIPMIGLKFDPNEFMNRGLLRISSVYSSKSDDVINSNSEIESIEEL